MKLPTLFTEMTLGPSSPVIVMVLPERVAVVVAEAATGRARSSAAARVAGTQRGMEATMLSPAGVRIGAPYGARGARGESFRATRGPISSRRCSAGAAPTRTP